MKIFTTKLTCEYYVLPIQIGSIDLEQSLDSLEQRKIPLHERSKQIELELLSH